MVKLFSAANARDVLRVMCAIPPSMLQGVQPPPESNGREAREGLQALSVGMHVSIDAAELECLRAEIAQLRGITIDQAAHGSSTLTPLDRARIAAEFDEGRGVGLGPNAGVEPTLNRPKEG